MLRKLVTDVAKQTSCRALQQYSASCSGVDRAAYFSRAAAQAYCLASFSFSTDFKASLLNASPKSLATDRVIAEPHSGVEQNVFTKALLRIGGFYSKESRLLRGAKAWYDCITEQIEDNRLIKAFGLEENFANKYAVLSIHVWLCLVRLRAEGKEGKELAQLLYENFQDDVEIRVRAAGVKVRISKHLTDLEQMFYGTSLAYDQALDGKEELSSAVLRNVYGDKAEKRKDADLLARYMTRELACLSMTDSDSVMNGKAGMPKDTGPFKHGEKVLVPHTDKHYEAKVIKSEKREDGLWYYQVHYQGWNKQWDEWVEAPGLHKWDPKLVDGAEEKEGDAGGPKRKGTGSKRPEKRRKVNDIGQQDAELPGEAGDPAVEVRLPAVLKQILVDEQDAIEKGLRGPPLPRKPCVADILHRYIEESREARQLVELEEQAATGLRVYFDKALRACLLYDHEADECDKVLADGVAPSSLYGAEHLLRLCAKLPFLVPISSAPPEGYAALQGHLAAFAAFLSQHQDFFVPVSKYVTAR